MRTVSFGPSTRKLPVPADIIDEYLETFHIVDDEFYK